MSDVENFTQNSVRTAGNRDPQEWREKDQWHSFGHTSGQELEASL